MNATQLSDETLEKILEGYANFKVWESQQIWADNHDRAGNIANSRGRAKDKLLAWRDAHTREAVRLARIDEATLFHRYSVSRYYGNWSASEQGLMESHRLFAVGRLAALKPADNTASKETK